MGGSDSSFGSGGGSQIPADPRDDEDASAMLRDERDDVINIDEPPDVVPARPEGDDFPRTTKPFRAWGAAHETRDRGPSLWARFRAWLSGLFHRDEASPDVADEGHGDGDMLFADERDATDAPWGNAGSLVTPEAAMAEAAMAEAAMSESAMSESAMSELAMSEAAPTVEPPKPSDFEAPWGDPFASSSREQGADDPLWDEPRVAESSPPPREAISGSDLNFVWSPPTPNADDLIAEAQHATDENAASPPPERTSFISRLFGRKKKVEPEPTAEFDAGWGAAAETAPSHEQPAVEDFAEDTSTGTEAALIESSPRPSLDHSAEDAAQLANLLAMTPARVAEVESDPAPAITEPESETAPIDASAAFEMSGADAATEEVMGEASIIETDVAQVVDDVDAPPVDDVVDPAILTEAAEPPPPPKKPGFFARLMMRRSQIRPPAPVAAGDDEPPVETAAEVAAETAAGETPVELDAVEEVEEVEDVEDVQVVEVVEVVEVTEDVEVIEAVARPDLIPEAAPAIPEPSAPEPYVPFVDARDEIRQELAAERATKESARITEAVPQPVEAASDDGETTDEFEVVPPQASLGGANDKTAEIGILGRLFGAKQGDITQPVQAVEKPAGTVAESAGRQNADGKAPFVLAKFRMFYNEIIRDKHQKSDVISGFATAIVSAAAADEADPEFAAQLLSKRLSEMLELQAAESNWTGGDAAKYYPDAQYAMVALADETFSTIDWPGRPSWHKYMLEPRMYSSRGADLEFFKRVDKLLREPNPPKGARDLARVYLLVIASGFRGKFRVPNLRRPLAEYRRRLYEFSHQADPLELYGRERRLLPETVNHTLAGRAVGRFSPAQKWIAAVVFLIVAYAAVSHFAWIKLSADLKDVMSRIEVNAGPAGGAR